MWSRHSYYCLLNFLYEYLCYSQKWCKCCCKPSKKVCHPEKDREYYKKYYQGKMKQCEEKCDKCGDDEECKKYYKNKYNHYYKKYKKYCGDKKQHSCKK